MASTLETVPPSEPQTPWTKSSPWGKPRVPIQPSSFTSVMDEQLAKDLQVRLRTTKIIVYDSFILLGEGRADRGPNMCSDYHRRCY